MRDGGTDHGANHDAGCANALDGPGDDEHLDGCRGTRKHRSKLEQQQSNDEQLNVSGQSVQ